MSNLDHRIQAIKSRLALIDPPPWTVETAEDGATFIRTGRKDGESRLFVRHDLQPAPDTDLTFIALARNLLERLVVAIECDDLGTIEPDELDAFDETARRATSGPWTPFIEDRQPIGGSSVIWIGDDDHGADMYLWLGDEMAPGDLFDFVAHSRTDAPSLAAEIRRQLR
jgi:hypothetical protein